MSSCIDIIIVDTITDNMGLPHEQIVKRFFSVMDEKIADASKMARRDRYTINAETFGRLITVLCEAGLGSQELDPFVWASDWLRRQPPKGTLRRMVRVVRSY